MEKHKPKTIENLIKETNRLRKEHGFRDLFAKTSLVIGGCASLFIAAHSITPETKELAGSLYLGRSLDITTYSIGAGYILGLWIDFAYKIEEKLTEYNNRTN